MASELVRIQRGRLSPDLQVVRAQLSIVSAVAPTNPARARQALNEAIAELNAIKGRLSKAEEGTA